MCIDVSAGRARPVYAIDYALTRGRRVVCICIAALLCILLPPVQVSAQDTVPGFMPDKALKAGALSKVDGNLLQLGHERATRQAQGGAAVMEAFKPLKSRMALRGSNNVVVDATAQSSVQDLEVDLESLGCTIVSVHQRLVSAVCPLAAIDNMGLLKNLNFVRPAVFTAKRGVVTSQGDAAMRADVSPDRLTLWTAAVLSSGRCPTVTTAWVGRLQMWVPVICQLLSKSWMTPSARL